MALILGRNYISFPSQGCVFGRRSGVLFGRLWRTPREIMDDDDILDIFSIAVGLHTNSHRFD